jgi:hypothetical protein
MERGMKPRREAKLGKCETRWRGGIIWSGKLPPQRLDAISPCVQGPPRAQQRLAFREPRGRRSCDIPQRAPPDRHIFPGIRPGKPVARSSVFDQAQQVSGGKASVHGWRASFRSWCSETGVAFEVAELSLAHAKTGVVAAYDRAQMIERRRVVMQQWANWLSGPATADVIPLAGRRG